jgi:hypothetical protein
MKSEEKLNRLFEILKKENTTTSFSEINSWIEAHTSIAKAKTVKPYNYSKIIIISSIITTTLIFSIILVSKKIASIEENKILPITKEFRITIPTDSIYSTDSSKNKIIEYIQDEIAFSKTKATSNTPINKIKRETIVKNEIQYPIDLSKHSKNDINETYPQTNIEKSSGIWRSQNDGLKVDTLFKGVKLIVFISDFNQDIIVNGSNRSDVALNYNHQLKAKGIYSTSKHRYCELNYVLADSILTMHCKRENYIFNGITIIGETNNLKIDVPKNISVQIQSSSGNIDLELLNPISEYSLDLITELGEIKEKRKDLKFLNKSHLVTGSGLFKISIKADRGDIIIR